MNPPVSTFTAIYTEWLATLRAMIPGGSHAGPANAPPSRESTPKADQAAAHEEWEDEGGCIKPEKKPAEHAPGPKIPF